MKQSAVVMILLAFVMVSCVQAPSERVIQTAIAQTQAADLRRSVVEPISTTKALISTEAPSSISTSVAATALAALPTREPTISPAQEMEAQNIVDLVQKGLITAQVTGAGINQLAVHGHNNTDELLQMVIPAGTYFVAGVNSAQNMVVRHTFSTPIQPQAEFDLTFGAACANLHRDQPGAEDTFTIQRTPDRPELTSVIAALNSTEVDYEIEQAAIWIVTDDASYDDLGILVGGFGFGARQIDENVTLQAMKLIQAAGLDIQSYAIWGDRDRLALNVTEPDLAAWLRDQGVAVVVQTTPAPGAGEISQFASEATASSQYSQPNWSATQAVGAPDTTDCGDESSAWASLESNGEDWLLLTYDQPVIPSRIAIYQTYNPGAVTLVEVLDQTGKASIVYQAAPEQLDKCPFILEIEVKDVKNPVSSIRITIDQRRHTGWNEIDAVQLIGRHR